MDTIQRVRNLLGESINLNSAHRCAIHNAQVGGAPLSQHKKLAFDISLAGHSRKDVLAACKVEGFTGFGFYQTFLHVDTRARPAMWYSGGRARELWGRG